MVSSIKWIANKTTSSSPLNRVGLPVCEHKHQSNLIGMNGSSLANMHIILWYRRVRKEILGVNTKWDTFLERNSNLELPCQQGVLGSISTGIGYISQLLYPNVTVAFLKDAIGLAELFKGHLWSVDSLGALAQAPDGSLSYTIRLKFQVRQIGFWY